MFDITPELLRKVAGASVNKEVVDGLVKYLPEVLEQYEINTKLRIAHFLAQLGHESDHFRTLQEYASGAAYEGRRDLGNVRRGDGRRYKGRGAIQLTGRHNYRKYGQLLGVDLENNPELAATPKISALTAAEYWKQHNLNVYADQDKLESITKRINGGYNGLESRRAMLARAKAALKNTTATVKPVTTKVESKPKDEPKVEKKPVETVTKPEEKNTSSPTPTFVKRDLEINKSDGGKNPPEKSL